MIDLAVYYVGGGGQRKEHRIGGLRIGFVVGDVGIAVREIGPHLVDRLDRVQEQSAIPHDADAVIRALFDQFGGKDDVHQVVALCLVDIMLRVCVQVILQTQFVFFNVVLNIADLAQVVLSQKMETEMNADTKCEDEHVCTH